MAKLSAGLLIYRKHKDGWQVLLVHPGGPFWARKDQWGMPKGEFLEGEEPLAVAKREFREELGLPAPAGKYLELGELKSSGKVITAFAIEADVDLGKIKSNVALVEWPPRSGQVIEVPEIDKAQYKSLSEAGQKIHKNQVEFIGRLAEKLGDDLPPTPVQSSLF
ncbi:MAG TPA: NUDIX domain-containing protein [Candidatus Saccharimonadales bacterium]|nr:NUDIX domain-containing protein [Candidatus Saccharimonadales bacterium]